MKILPFVGLSLLPLALAACGDPTGTPPARYELVANRWMTAQGAAWQTRELFLMGMDGRGAVNLTHTDGAHEDSPAWSPDGTRIAFIRSTGDDRAPEADLWVMDADGSGQLQITSTGRAERWSAPSWSPDGRRIAYAADGDLHVVGADGRNPTRMMVGLHEVRSPAWSGWRRPGRPTGADGSDPTPRGIGEVSLGPIAWRP